MRLFRRGDDETLNDKLLREAGYSHEGVPVEAAPSRQDDVPDERDAIVFTLDEPDLDGTAYEFVTFADGSMVVDEAAPDVSSLADAVEASIEPPYRASAVRQNDGYWLVTAQPIVVEMLTLEGDELELSLLAAVTRFAVDGAETDAPVPLRLMHIGEEAGGDFVVRATRLDGDLWEVRADQL
jgi:hypothetical protein